MAAVIGDPQPPMPAFSAVDLGPFWRTFDDRAPVHLRGGLRMATVMLGIVLPRLLGHGRGLVGLSADDRDAVVQKAATLPLFSDLLEVAKLVGCFAYFSGPAVQDAARGRV